MGTNFITITFDNGEKYLIEAESFSIGIGEEDGGVFNANSYYNGEQISKLKSLLSQNILKINITKDEELLYESEEWKALESIAIHYSDYYKKMMINYIFGAI